MSEGSLPGQMSVFEVSACYVSDFRNLFMDTVYLKPLYSYFTKDDKKNRSAMLRIPVMPSFKHAASVAF